jgi:hypothetical protein
LIRIDSFDPGTDKVNQQKGYPYCQEVVRPVRENYRTIPLSRRKQDRRSEQKDQGSDQRENAVCLQKQHEKKKENNDSGSDANRCGEDNEDYYQSDPGYGRSILLQPGSHLQLPAFQIISSLRWSFDPVPDLPDHTL